MEIEQQYEDNMKWLAEADKHQMVVGSQARILYSDQVGRVKIARAFNDAVATGKLKVYFLAFYELKSQSNRFYHFYDFYPFSRP